MANKTLYGLNEADRRLLTRLLDQFRLSGSAFTGNVAGPRPTHGGGLLVKLADTVDARSGSTPGSGLATIMQLDDAGELEERSQAAQITVYNSFLADVGTTGDYTHVLKDPFGNHWLITEDCS